MPSAWNPGAVELKPRSTSSSMRASRSPAHCEGTDPLMRNHVVPHGRPQLAPTSVVSYGRTTASAKGTGSPGASHRSIVTAARCRCNAGASRSVTNRATRASTDLLSSCIV